MALQRRRRLRRGSAKARLGPRLLCTLLNVMSAVCQIRWSALTVLALVATMLAFACDGRSAERPDGTTTGGGGIEARSLKVMSVNIYLGGKKDQPGLEGIACYLSNADVVFLQEVDKAGAEVLARKSGLENFRFAKDQGMRVGEYGVATLSRFPLEAVEVYTLPGTPQGYDVILRTDARIWGRSVTLINAFYPAGYDEEGRRGRLEASQMVVDLLDHTEGPVVLGGDLNAGGRSPEVARLAAEMTDSWEAAPEDRYHCEKPFGRIDYVFFRGPFVVQDYKAPCWPLEKGDLPVHPKPGCSLQGAWLSDHPFLTAELEMRAASST
jgi:endonuclease/exonuclease/phosphatase family metal-dependent hydrolase